MPKGDLQQGRVPTHKDVSVSLEGLLQLPQRVCHHKAECRPQSFLILLQLPQEMWYRKAECQTLSFLILCLRLLLFPIQAKQPMAGRLGEQGRVPIQQPSFSPRAAPRSDPSQAANDGSQAAGREQGRVPSVVQEGRVPVDRIAAHAVNGPVPEQSGISPNQAEAEVASAPEPVGVASADGARHLREQ